MQGLRFPTTATRNKKLVGDRTRIPMFATYRAVGPTCPSSCPFLENGCYAQQGNTRLHQADRYGENDGRVFLESLAMLPPNAIVRLHVSGDVMLDGVVDEPYLHALIAGARRRPDVTFFGYTHAWREIDLERFVFPENLILNASCESDDAVDEARSQGWDTVTVVPKATAWKRQGDTVVCPNQTMGVSCYECGLCMKPLRNLTVAFRVHGSAVKKAESVLPMAN